MAEYLTLISSQIGIPIWLLFVMLAWEIIWKLLAMWKSAKNNSVVWFIVLAVFNTIGILPILYIYVFSELGKKKVKKKKSK